MAISGHGPSHKNLRENNWVHVTFFKKISVSLRTSGRQRLKEKNVLTSCFYISFITPTILNYIHSLATDFHYHAYASEEIEGRNLKHY